LAISIEYRNDRIGSSEAVDCLNPLDANVLPQNGFGERDVNSELAGEVIDETVYRANKRVCPAAQEVDLTKWFACCSMGIVGVSRVYVRADNGKMGHYSGAFSKCA
jgi:hypothetical protein